MLKSSVVYSVKGFGIKTPALFISTSIRPNRDTAVSTIVADVSINQCNIRGPCEWIFFGDVSRVCDQVVSSFEERFNESRSDPSRGTSYNCCFRRICHL